jgi:uncharacterized protein YciI
MSRFVVELIYGEDQDHRMQVRPAHREYTKQLAEQGIVLAGGPFADQRGGLLVYEAADVDELRRILDADPYTKAGVIAETTIREWEAVTGTWLS